MSPITIPPPPREQIVYPESDGKPMAESTLQYRWIVTIIEGLAALFRDRPDVFVAGDLLWYPVEGQPKVCAAPDAMVAFGRLQGDRGSYLQWNEQDIPPQVVFEVLSPSNTAPEMHKKFDFYQRYGVEEYYVYDPQTNDLLGWRRTDVSQPFAPIAQMAGWVSPRLGITFDWTRDRLRLVRPDGKAFETFEEVERRANQAEDRANQAEDRAEQAEDRAEQAEDRAEQARLKAERLAAKLRELGIDPEG
jgi:Uma2 family endonuclease